ncbi:penicillinase repressor family protein [Asticcacaulis biprosthecium C19]|uniref:Penicillinase repressor family protein n=1 Tax=Asticcacaulis biprosthecium C19 TaxID=715226 RepID=F4QRD5_9CAUL|nr:BlaI/MecI/CopY family transcriptional regulator [Asticcacaulis biprosthecium]EGF90772.1 penicillinase repressor family protein [Asticcacaulis biprosthecium C19]
MTTIQITEAERVLMEALWRSGPLTAAELMAAVKAVEPWAEPTIKTLLHRLMQRQAIRSDRSVVPLRYLPLLNREAYVAQQVDDLVKRLFEGDRIALAAYLADKS